MLYQHVKLTLRQLWKERGYALVNIAGLAAGLAGCLLISLVVIYELSFDRFYPGGDRTCRLELFWGKGGNPMKFVGVMPAMGPALRGTAGVEAAGRLRYEQGLEFKIGKQVFQEEWIAYADPSIPELFSLTWVAGAGGKTLQEPFSLALSETLAKKYFGQEPAIGQTLYLDSRPVTVTGVFRDLPAHTHLRFQGLLSYRTLESLGQYPANPWSQWGMDRTYVRLKPGTSFESFAVSLKELFEKHASPELAGSFEWVVQPLAAIHWDQDAAGNFEGHGNRLFINLFIAAAILLLVIGCFNFVNFSASRHLERMKEVGVRKVLGASRMSLQRQFLVESMLVAGLALGLAGAIFALTRGWLYEYLNVELVLSPGHLQVFAGIIVLLVLAVGLVAGAWPARVLARLEPARIFRDRLRSRRRQFTGRHAMIMGQFAMSVVLIFGVLVIFRQLDHMRNFTPGMKKENVALAFLPSNREDAAGKYQLFRDRLRQYPVVQGVSGAFSVPGVNSRSQMRVLKPGQDLRQAVSLQALPVDTGFVKTMGLTVLAGRDFNPERSSDAGDSILLNETAVRVLDYKKPVGERLRVPVGESLKEMTIIGVVKDFHVRSLREPVAPCVIMVQPSQFILAAVRYAPGGRKELESAVAAAWKEVYPEAPPVLRELTDACGAYYRTEEKSGVLLGIFMLLALTLSAIGLSGFSSFLAGRRTREIGIRKVHGATVLQIVSLLSGRLTVWVMISCLAGWPVAYWLARRWLESFYLRVSLDVWYFVISGSIILFISLLTAGLMAWLSARANPVECLRHE